MTTSPGQRQVNDATGRCRTAPPPFFLEFVMDAKAKAEAVAKILGAKKEGSQWKARCPAHHGEDFNLAIFVDRGDAQVCCHSHGCKPADIWSSIRELDVNRNLKEFDSFNGNDRKQSALDKIKAGLKRKAVEPEQAEPLDQKSVPPYVVEDEKYWYTTAAGEPHALVLRYFRDGKKTFSIRRWDGSRYVAGKPDGKMPLYNVEKIAAKPDAPILIVEGEKCADAAETAVNGYLPITWQGGCKNVAGTDWAPLKGRDLVLWPDADHGGLEATKQIAALSNARSIRMVQIPKGKNSGWDICDAINEGLDPNDMIAGSVEYTEPKPARDPLALIRGADLASMAAPDWLIKGILGTVGESAIYGPYASGKTFFTLDMCAHVAMGWPWQGRKVKQGAVVYISSEGGVGSMKNRFNAWCQAHDVDPKDVPIYFLCAAVDFGNDTKDAEGIAEQITDLNDPVVLVVVDTYARALAGLRENESDAVSAFLNNIASLKDASGHVCIIHHPGKDAGRGMRGSYALPAALDTVIELKRDEDAKITNVTIEKVRDGEAGQKTAFALKIVTLGVDEDGEPITSCVIDPSEATTSGKSLTPQQKDAMNILYDQVSRSAERSADVGLTTHIPGELPVVRENAWKLEMVAQGVINANHANSEAASFRKIRNSLKRVGIIGFRKPFVWIPNQPNRGEPSTNRAPEQPETSEPNRTTP